MPRLSIIVRNSYLIMTFSNIHTASIHEWSIVAFPIKAINMNFIYLCTNHIRDPLTMMSALFILQFVKFGLIYSKFQIIIEKNNMVEKIFVLNELRNRVRYIAPQNMYSIYPNTHNLILWFT